MTRTKISTTVYITDEQDRKLKELSRRTNVPVAVYIREGVDIVIGKYGDVLPGQLPLLKPRAD
jgi:predicted DNA-binding protein